MIDTAAQCQSNHLNTTRDHSCSYPELSLQRKANKGRAKERLANEIAQAEGTHTVGAPMLLSLTDCRSRRRGEDQGATDGQEAAGEHSAQLSQIVALLIHAAEEPETP